MCINNYICVRFYKLKKIQMKKIYLSICAILVAGPSFAQQNDVRTVEYSDNTSKFHWYTSNENTSKAPPFWSDDFSDASLWTMTDYAHAGTQNWVIGTASPTGQYSAPMGAISSTTAANGFAMYDSDALATSAANAQDATLSFNNSIDCSAYQYVNLSFESYHRKFQDSVFVEVFQVNPTSVDITSDTSIAIGEQLQLWANTSGTKSFEWDPGDDLNCSNCADPIFNGTESQNYTVSIIDSNQCLESQEYVFIEVRDEFTVNLPQAFSPNGDGISDIIKVKGWGIKELLDFKVYNRWGELIYHGQDINNGWNGEYKGEKQN